MDTGEEAQLLRVFIGEKQRWKGKPLYEAIVKKARDRGLAGATAIRGRLGFGAKNHVSTTRVIRLSEDLPYVVEIVDRADRIQEFIPEIKEMVTEGLVTLEKAQIIVYGRNEE